MRRSVLDAYAASERVAELTRRRHRCRRPLSRHRPWPASSGRWPSSSRPTWAPGSFTRSSRGYDTHAGQSNTHYSLLFELGGAVKAFLDDLTAAKLADRVTVIGFSEFGRRVAENGSAGTDHGTAGLVFLAGPGVQPGVHGKVPSLTDLVDGDPKITTDFRRVYAAVLEDWLGLPSRTAFGAAFEPMPLFRPTRS